MELRNEQGIPPSLVNGRLEGLSVPDLLWNLCRRRSTGVLHLTSSGLTKKVYIDAGRIVFALSGDPNDRLGDLLLREGQITLDQFEAAFVKLSSGKRLGTLLVDAGHLSPENLVRGVVSQVKAIVLGLFPLEEGEYAFVEGPLPTEEVITLGMRTGEILLQGIRQIRSFTRIRKSVGPISTRYKLDSGWRTALEGLEIRDGERMLVQRLEETGAQGASVEALCREIFLSNFEIYQALWAFLVLGIVVELDRGLIPAVGGSASGRVERTNLPEILVRLCRDEVTGVLQMSRGTLERTLHIQDGGCVFATSNSIDDGLVAHLLRRGVISLSDREETARRLLSNKRVGTILLEMGVIDESDLLATVREQLSEIIFDTFRWDQGDFRFLEGPLPTIEEITLNRTVEDLVFAGVRRVTSWARVREGCGGLNARLVLLPRYLSVLDKITVGPEEWELISLLKTPKSVLQICRESVLGDFRSCQILWALRLLGGVGEAPIEVSVDSALGLLHAQPAATPAPEAEAPAMASSGSSADEAGKPIVIPVVADPGPITVVSAEPDAAIPRELDRPAIPLSEADVSAEVISEPWRLAAERPPDLPQSASIEELPAVSPEEAGSAETPAAFTLDAPGDATVAISSSEVEGTIHRPDDGLPRFELGEPGTGLEDMKIDMRPAAPSPLEMDRPKTPSPEILAPEPAENVDLNRTARVSREDLESALREPPSPVPGPAASEAAAHQPEAADPPPAWDPPENLDGMIASFNARHIVLFRALRAEIGAGAANFVRSCRGSLDHGLGAVFETAELRADGSFDPEGLKRAVMEHRRSDAPDGFQRLLDGELARLRAHLGEKRAAALADQMAAIS